MVGETIALYEPLTEVHNAFHASQLPIAWLLGGNQSGKSYTNMMDLTMLALNIHPYKRTRPRAVHWACIEAWDQVRDVLWEEQLKNFIPYGAIRLPIMYGQEKVPRRIYLQNGHRIEFKAFNQGREQFQGRAIDSCHCDEQCHHDFQGILTELQARLLKRSGLLRWSMSPIMPQMELEERVEKQLATDDVFHVDLNWNRVSRGGHIPDERVDQMIADWPEEMQLTRIEGRFSSYLGAVFKTFNRSVHVVKPRRIPKKWRRFGAIDFGFTNPFVFLWGAKDDDDNWYIYKEYCKARTGIQEHVDNIGPYLDKFPLRKIYADPENAEDRAFLRKAGYPTLKANKSVARGIEHIQKKLKVKTNGKPSLFIFNTCRNLIKELGVYYYPTGTAKTTAKDIPVGVNDHSIDALRYLLYSEERPKKKGRA